MSLREWLIAIGTLVILAIVIDGIRRMRRARKDAMSISSGMGVDDLQESPLDEEHNPELPNGGARPITRDTLQERGYLKSHGRTRFANPEPKPTRPVISSRSNVETDNGQDDSRLEDHPGDDLSVTARESSVADQQTSEWALDEPSPEEFESESGWGAIDEDPDTADEVLGEVPPSAPTTDTAPTRSEPDIDTEDPVEQDNAPPVVTSEVEDDTARRAQPARDSTLPPAGANRPDAEEVLVINVLAKHDQAFGGPALKKLFEACGLLHGDMDIYHRHEDVDTRSPVQFSVANAVEPGTFRPDEISKLSTPGISFFMSMPGPSNAMQAFEFMVETAQCVVRNLGGELKDERRSVMTPQTIEHCRQRIREYERKHHSVRG